MIVFDLNVNSTSDDKLRIIVMNWKRQVYIVVNAIFTDTWQDCKPGVTKNQIYRYQSNHQILLIIIAR